MRSAWCRRCAPPADGSASGWAWSQHGPSRLVSTANSRRAQHGVCMGSRLQLCVGSRLQLQYSQQGASKKGASGRKWRLQGPKARRTRALQCLQRVPCMGLPCQHAVMHCACVDRGVHPTVARASGKREVKVLTLCQHCVSRLAQ
jgi:hypothetical protein